MEPDAGGSNVYGNIQTNGSMEDANVSKRFCSYCGKEIMAQAIICPHCGCAVAASPEVDIPSTGLNVLSFFIPLVGLILYCVHQNKTPRKARAIGKWALIGFGVDMFVSILLYMVIFLLLYYINGGGRNPAPALFLSIGYTFQMQPAEEICSKTSKKRDKEKLKGGQQILEIQPRRT